MKTIHNISIFLVDDDPLFLKSLEFHLQHKLNCHIKIKTFPCGEDCLNNLSQKPDIIVLDYLLNNNDPLAMNGIQVLEKIKESNPSIEVIILSVHDKVKIAVETMKNGAYDYVIKNDTVFLKFQTVIRNLIHTIVIKNQSKNYRRLAILSCSIILTIVLVVFYKRIFSNNLN